MKEYKIFLDQIANHGYAVWDQYFTADFTSQLRRDIASYTNSFKEAGIGKDRQISSIVRKNSILWLNNEQDTSNPQKQAIQVLSELMEFINEHSDFELIEVEAHLAKYPEGGFYKKHIDTISGPTLRLISIVIYLNQYWTFQDGGQLRLYTTEGIKDILPANGKMVCFLSSEIPHEVLITNRDRLALIAWFRADNEDWQD